MYLSSSGVFVVLQAYGALVFAQSHLTGKEFRFLFMAAIVGSAGVVFLSVVLLTYLGYVAPWSGRFYSLWDTG